MNKRKELEKARSIALGYYLIILMALLIIGYMIGNLMFTVEPVGLKILFGILSLFIQLIVVYYAANILVAIFQSFKKGKDEKDQDS